MLTYGKVHQSGVSSAIVVSRSRCLDIMVEGGQLGGRRKRVGW